MSSVNAASIGGVLYPSTMSGSTADLFARTDREAAIDELHAATALYTQDPIVQQLLDRLSWPNGGGALLDTSCGDGAFLTHALERLLIHEPTISDEDIIARIVGYEIHFFAAAEARARIKDRLITHGLSAVRATSIAARLIRCSDFLTEAPRNEQFDVIVGSPPYLRMLNVPSPLREEYAAIVPDYARADLLHSFLDRCVTHLTPNGELGLVTADRWLFNESAVRLREVVGGYFGLFHLERLNGDSAFRRPKLRRAGTPPRVHPVAVVLKTHEHSVRPIGRDPIYPDEATLAPPPNARRLDKVAIVRVAPWLGTRGVFVLDAEACTEWPAGSTVPAIDTDDLADGVLRVPRRCAICTQPDVEPPAVVRAHLDRELPRMCRRGRSAKRMPPESFHRLDLTRPCLVVPRISRTLRTVRVPAGILPVNHNLSIVWAGALRLDEIEVELSSQASQRWIREHAARLDNGYYSITTRLLRSLPISAA